MITVRHGFVVVGCVLVGFVTSAGTTGLVARAAEPERWVESVVAASDGDSAPGGSEAQLRIAQLEQRLKELEAQRHAATPGSPALGAGSDELNAVLARNNELVARNRTLAAENQALAQSHLFETPPSAAACAPPPGDADPKAQLRYWAERLRDGDDGLRDGLTIEQNAALNVLLRHERTLDPHNPWRDQ
jgi:hypothetical protein